MTTPDMPDDVRARLDALERARPTSAAMPEDVRAAAGVPPLTPSRGFLRTVDDLARMGAQGATFGFADEIAAGGDAALGAMRDLFVPRTLSDLVTNRPRGFGARYDANLAAERARDRDARAASPWLAPAAEIGGGVLAGGLLGRLFPAIFGAAVRTAPAVAPTVAPTIPATIRTGATVGAAGGAIGGFGAGEGGFEDRAVSALQGGALGAAAGAAVPPLVRGAGMVIAPVANALGLRNVPQAAMGQLLRAFERDGISLEDAGRRLEQWQASGARPETLLDLGGENVRGMAQRLVNVPGAARVAGQAAVEARTTGQGERVLEDVRQLGRGGTGGQYYPELDALDQARRTAAAPLYERAYANQFPWTEQVEAMFSRPAMQQASRNAVNELRNRGINPEGEGLRFNEAGDIINVRGLSMRALDYIKRGLDDVLDGARNPITRRIEGHGSQAIDDMRGTFVRALDAANPDYAAARSAWAGPSRLRDAMELGRDIFGRDAELSAAAVRRMPDSEREAFRLGAVRAISDRINNTTDGRNVVARFFGSPGQRARLEAAFDDPEAFARFRASMEREAGMTQVTPFMNPRANSITSRMLAEGADQAVDVPGAVTSILMGETRPAIRGALAGTMNRLQGIGSQGSDVLAPLLFQTTAQGNRTALGLLGAEARRRAFAQQQAEGALRGSIFGGTAGAASETPPMPFYPRGQ